MNTTGDHSDTILTLPVGTGCALGWPDAWFAPAEGTGLRAASRIVSGSLHEVPPRRRTQGRETPERAQRRAERRAFAARLAAMRPGMDQAVRIEGVPLNLRATWRGRVRAASRSLNREFDVRVRGATMWVICAEEAPTRRGA
jgi:hypothetical protein